jgi:TetR/AcrR family transcriptional regulator
MDNRSRLLDHALEAFALQGYEATGVQQIAAAAGITKPTLYHYFGSKAGLLTTLFSERLEPFLAKLAETATYRKDMAGALQEIVKTHFTFAEANPLLYRFLMALLYAPVESDAFKISQTYHARQLQLMEIFFFEASKDHGNMMNRQKTYAASFLGLVNTYVSLTLNQQIRVDETIIRNVVHQFMHGIFS